MPTKLNLPTPLVLVLGLAGGVLEFFNTYSFGFSSPVKAAITYGLIAIGVFAVSPLVGSAWKNALDTVLHLSPAVASAVSIVGTLLAAAVNTFTSLDSMAKGIILAVVAFLQFVGFGPASITELATKAGFVKTG